MKSQMFVFSSKQMKCQNNKKFSVVCMCVRMLGEIKDKRQKSPQITYDLMPNNFL
jgi:hypothetical protein